MPLKDTVYKGDLERLKKSREDAGSLSNRAAGYAGDVLNIGSKALRGKKAFSGSSDTESRIKELDRAIDSEEEAIRKGDRTYVYDPESGGKPFKAGGKVSSASSRADGCAVRGKTKGRIV